jgi:hypothetical protein
MDACHRRSRPISLPWPVMWSGMVQPRRCSPQRWLKFRRLCTVGRLFSRGCPSLRPCLRRWSDLVDLLLERGCEEVVVAAALSTGDRDRGHRSVETLARSAALTGRSRRGRRYDLVDLGESTVSAPVPKTSVLAGQSVSCAW